MPLTFPRTASCTAVASFVAVAILPAVQAGEGQAGDETSPRTPILQKIRMSDDGTQFLVGNGEETFSPWGFNYVGPHGTIVEEIWADDWPRIEKDFRTMRELGANVVRIHLQFGTYMASPDEAKQEELDRLKRLLDLAAETGLYLDLTGLGCYHIDRVPDWYDDLDEAKRWKAQALFWEVIAEKSAGHPAVFCYDLMNEPILAAAKEGEHPWLTGELGGMHFVQRISNDAAGREREEIVEAWVKTLTTAIRKHDPRTPITVGVIPWANVWPNAKPLFYSPSVAKHLDFVSVHFYPESNEVERSIKALAVYDIGKPLVVEETFPLNCSIEELDQFIEGTKTRSDGWIAHFFGHTIEEHEQGAEPAGSLVAAFLTYWRDKGQTMGGSSTDANNGDPR